MFDYQSVCHCSKTANRLWPLRIRLITSQFVTAPKQLLGHVVPDASLITSQFVTAPKHGQDQRTRAGSLITSQFVTAPKPIETNSSLRKDRQTNRHYPKSSRNS